MASSKLWAKRIVTKGRKAKEGRSIGRTLLGQWPSLPWRARRGIWEKVRARWAAEGEGSENRVEGNEGDARCRGWKEEVCTAACSPQTPPATAITEGDDKRRLERTATAVSAGQVLVVVIYLRADRPTNLDGGPAPPTATRTGRRSHHPYRLVRGRGPAL